MDQAESNFMVPKYYKMNPETDDLVFGERLLDGMVILAESFIDRVDLADQAAIEHGDSPRSTMQMLKHNRWCRVTDLEYLGGGNLKFIGVYEDFTKFSHVISTEKAWIVRKDSMRDIPAELTDRHERMTKIEEIVREALRYSFSVPEGLLDVKAEEFGPTAHLITRRIFENADLEL